MQSNTSGRPRIGEMVIRKKLFFRMLRVGQLFLPVPNGPVRLVLTDGKKSSSRQPFPFGSHQFPLGGRELCPTLCYPAPQYWHQSHSLPRLWVEQGNRFLKGTKQIFGWVSLGGSSPGNKRGDRSGPSMTVEPEGPVFTAITVLQWGLYGQSLTYNYNSAQNFCPDFLHAVHNIFNFRYALWDTFIAQDVIGIAPKQFAHMRGSWIMGTQELKFSRSLENSVP